MNLIYKYIRLGNDDLLLCVQTCDIAQYFPHFRSMSITIFDTFIFRVTNYHRGSGSTNIGEFSIWLRWGEYFYLTFQDLCNGGLLYFVFLEKQTDALELLWFVQSPDSLRALTPLTHLSRSFSGQNSLIPLNSHRTLRVALIDIYAILPCIVFL